MEATKTQCCGATKVAPKSKSSVGGASFLTTLLLILIPKCPFCVMAYSGAILMFFDVKNSAIMPYVVHFKPVLGALVILLILFNYKGRKTLLSLLIAGLAMTFLVFATYFYNSILPDWVLYAAFLFAAWYNGNFNYFYRFLRFGKQKV